MQIIIDDTMVWLDEEANEYLTKMKETMKPEELENWLENWLVSTVVPALMDNYSETTLPN